jgi:hypothetical protein
MTDKTNFISPFSFLFFTAAKLFPYTNQISGEIYKDNTSVDNARIYDLRLTGYFLFQICSDCEAELAAT